MNCTKKISSFLGISAILLLSVSTQAQNTIQGKILGDTPEQYLDSVVIRNIHSNKVVVTNYKGEFMVEVNAGELLTVTKENYKTLRVRIQNPKNPSFYFLQLEKDFEHINIYDVNGKPLNQHADSLRFIQTFGHLVNREQKGDISFQSMPLAMLSKRNREIWAFQAKYKKWQNEKYIDFAWNKNLIEKITYLEKDDLENFMRIYRPSYDFIRNSTEYEFLNYIKQSFYKYKSNQY